MMAAEEEKEEANDVSSRARETERDAGSRCSARVRLLLLQGGGRG